MPIKRLAPHCLCLQKDDRGLVRGFGQDLLGRAWELTFFTGIDAGVNILSYHNLFTKTFPFTILITCSSFYVFSIHILHLIGTKKFLIVTLYTPDKKLPTIIYTLNNLTRRRRRYSYTTFTYLF